MAWDRIGAKRKELNGFLSSYGLDGVVKDLLAFTSTHVFANAKDGQEIARFKFKLFAIHVVEEEMYLKGEVTINDCRPFVDGEARVKMPFYPDVKKYIDYLQHGRKWNELFERAMPSAVDQGLLTKDEACVFMDNIDGFVKSMQDKAVENHVLVRIADILTD